MSTTQDAIPFPTTTLHVYRIDDGETFWYVAASAEQALQRYLKDTFDETEEVFRERLLPGDSMPEVEQLPDDHKLTVTWTDGPRDENGDEQEITMTCKEWAAEAATTENWCVCSSVY
jgi:hypothetical protein